MRRLRAVWIACLVLAPFVAADGAWAGILVYNSEAESLTYAHEPSLDGASSHDVEVVRQDADFLITDTRTFIFDFTDDCRYADDTGHAMLCPADAIDELRVFLSPGPDRLTIDAALPSFACGAGGSDRLAGGTARDVMGGGPGRDELYGGDGPDSLLIDLGVLSEDCAQGDGAEDLELVDGGGGRDSLEGGPGDDVIRGGEDDDTVSGAGGDDELAGEGGGDVMFGLEGNDIIDGGDGRDFLYGSQGDDRIYGGPGDDIMGRTARYDAGGLQGDVPRPALSVEEGDDRLDGGDGDDSMAAGPGESLDDYLDPLAAAGRPFIDRGQQTSALNGADRFIGGPGTDFVSYINRDAPVSASLDGIANDGSPGEGDGIDPDVERVAGGARDDVLSAARGGTFLFGDLGGDTIQGGPGPDVLSGGADDGADTLRGGGAGDELRGGPGDDRLDGDEGDDALIGGAGDDRVEGGAGTDGLEGGTGADGLAGGAGPDCLHGFVFPARAPGETFACPRGSEDSPAVGADGDDLLDGGGGADRLEGGPGQDLADYSTVRAPVVIAMAGVTRERAAAYGASSNGDHLGADVEGVRGGGGNDTLLGNAGDNVLDGGPGDDQVDGGGGVDQLRGGSGRDLVVARDGQPDAVRCGTRRDLALVDGRDEVVSSLADSCERVDAGGRGGRAALLAPAGRACELPVRLPGIGRQFRLAVSARVPWGTRADASSCSARVRGAGNAPAGRRAALLGSGAFELRRRGRGVEVRLRGGRSRACGRSRQRVRRLSVSRPPRRFFVRGRTARVEGPGAAWVTVDGCRGTRVRVRTGRVEVFDLRHRRTRVESR